MFTLTITTDDDAIATDGGVELARILRSVAVDVENNCAGSTALVRDVNGNRVGRWDWSDD